MVIVSPQNMDYYWNEEHKISQIAESIQRILCEQVEAPISILCGFSRALFRHQEMASFVGACLLGEAYDGKMTQRDFDNFWTFIDDEFLSQTNHPFILIRVKCIFLRGGVNSKQKLPRCWFRWSDVCNCASGLSCDDLIKLVSQESKNGMHESTSLDILMSDCGQDFQRWLFPENAKSLDHLLHLIKLGLCGFEGGFKFNPMNANYNELLLDMCRYATRNRNGLFEILVPGSMAVAKAVASTNLPLWCFKECLSERVYAHIERAYVDLRGDVCKEIVSSGALASASSQVAGLMSLYCI